MSMLLSAFLSLSLLLGDTSLFHDDPFLKLMRMGGAWEQPIRINLRSPRLTEDQQVGLQKGGVQEQLKRVRVFAAFVDATAIKSCKTSRKDLNQIITSSQCTSHQIYLVTDSFSRFVHAPTWNLPTAHNHHPMHNNHSDQFGVKVAKDVPRLQAAGNVRLSVLFPQLEEQLYLPSCS